MYLIIYPIYRIYLCCVVMCCAVYLAHRGSRLHSREPASRRAAEARGPRRRPELTRAQLHAVVGATRY
jgi:hypothetical protein